MTTMTKQNKIDTAFQASLTRASSFANGMAEVRVPWRRDGAIITLTTEPLGESPSTAAWYNPKSGDISVNIAVPFADRMKQHQFLRSFEDGNYVGGDAGMVWGFIAHEAAHSQWTTWVPADLDRSIPPMVVGAMVLFEEIRIEKRAVDRGRTAAVQMLRQSFRWLLRELVADPTKIGTDPFSVAHCWALAYGRFIAGIADRAEVEAIDSLARTALGDDTVDSMREILGEATGNCTLDHLTRLGQEWVDLLKPLAPEQPEGGMTITVILHGPKGVGEGVPGGGGGEGEEEGDEGEGSASGKGDEEGDGDATGKGEQGHDDTPRPPGEGGGTGYGVTDEELAEVLASVIKDIEASMMEYTEPPQPEEPLSDPTTTAAKIFNPKRKRGAHWHEEEPKPELRSRAQRLARTLEALALPSVTLTHRASTLPPGRLRGREAVRQSAERSRGMMTTATPWSQAKRRHTSTRPVIVGVATDTSGSMAYAARFVAEFAWMMATAGHRIGARTAAVTFGEHAEAVTRPGEIPQQVQIRAANGGHENFDEAMASLEGVLHYQDAVGSAKILFVVSDGNLVKPGEMLKAQKWLRDLTKAGTLVVWLGVEGQHRVDRLTKMVTDKRLVQFTEPGLKDTTRLVAEMEATVIRAARSI